MSSTPRVLGALAALLACDTPAESCGDGRRDNGVLCFPAPAVRHFGQGFAPAELAVLDLDGDGELDLAAANPARQTLSVTWGGPLARMTSWPVGRPLAGLAHGDFDGDGHQDLAAALPADDGVVVLSGRGARRFVQAMHPAGASPRVVLGADLDGDGRSELLTANRRRTIEVPGLSPGGGGGVQVHDLDGDAAPDVIVSGSGGGFSVVRQLP